MAVQILSVDIYHPLREDIVAAVDVLKKGGIVVYPTGTIYGLGADIYNKEAINRILKIKKESRQKLFSFVCGDLKEASKWAHIPNQAFRIMKRVLPGKFTFVLPASNDVPKSIIQKRRTVGIRIPDSEIARKICEELGRPILSTSVPKGGDDYSVDPFEIADRYKHELNLVLACGVMPSLPSTIVDFTVNPPEIIREGAGDINNLF